MNRTSIAVRAWTRTGATAVIVALVISITALPAAAGAIPAVNNFNPDSGAVGATVHVYGANFTGATSVRFNGVAATPFTVVGPGNIMTTVPAGATTGPVSVTTAAGTGTSSANFVVTQGNGLTISSFTPTSGSVGTAVGINGTGFSNVSAVRFNGVSATFSVASTTRINTTVPSGATTGKISVTTSAGTVTERGTFTVGAQDHRPRAEQPDPWARPSRSAERASPASRP